MSRCRRRFCGMIVRGILVFAAVVRGWCADADFTAGTKKMAGRIDAILKAQDPMRNSFRSAERAAILREAAAKSQKEEPNSPRTASLVSQLAIEELRAGEMEDSLKALDDLQ